MRQQTFVISPSPPNLLCLSFTLPEAPLWFALTKGEMAGVSKFFSSFPRPRLTSPPRRHRPPPLLPAGPQEGARRPINRIVTFFPEPITARTVYSTGLLLFSLSLAPVSLFRSFVNVAPGQTAFAKIVCAAN